jgi:3-oxoacyl-[acyl-carrier-protein] synthase-3
MASLVFSKASIAGIASTFPCNKVSTADLAASVGVDSDRIISMTGIENRRIAPDHICASDLCVDAAERLLDELGWQRETIEAIIFVTQSPDYVLPATACIIQQRIRASDQCLCFDVNMGCSGYVYGLSIAFSMVQSGLKRVLLLVGDTSNRYLSPQDRSVMFLFGDSGTATAIHDKPSSSGFVVGTDGSGAKDLIIEGGQARKRPRRENLDRVADEGGNMRSPCELYMNGAEVMAFTLRVVPKLYSELLELVGVTSEAFDAVVMHQANKFLLDNLARKIGLDRARVPSSVRHFGNTSCASIAVTITECLSERLKSRNERLALIGFGVGWSWGACSVELDHIVIPATNFLA